MSHMLAGTTSVLAWPAALVAAWRFDRKHTYTHAHILLASELINNIHSALTLLFLMVCVDWLQVSVV